MEIKTLFIIFLIYFLSTILYFIYSKIVTKRKEKAIINSFASKPLSVQTSFDPLIGSGKGMDAVNDFLKITYLKFINTKLVQLNESTSLPVTTLISKLSSNDEMGSFTQGFVSLVSETMSKDLKYFFNKYYNVLEDGNANDIFVIYVTEWFIIAIRSLQATYTLIKKKTDDSIQADVDANDQLFLEIESELYEKLKIIENKTNGGV